MMEVETNNLITPNISSYNSPRTTQEGEGLSMAGHVRCKKCGKRMSKPVCLCGNTKCYIVIYWHGKHYKFYKYYQDGVSLHFERADRQLTVMRSQIDNKMFNPHDWMDSKISERKFERKMEEWLRVKKEGLENNEYAPMTCDVYQSFFKKYYKPFFSGWDVREIGYEQLENFKDDFLSRKLKINSRKSILRVLHAFFTWLKKKGVIKEIPQFPTVEGDDSKVRIVLDYEEQQDILKKIPQPYRDPIELAMETGLRSGEVCALKMRDIYLDKEYAIIQRTYSGNKLKETTKSKKKRPIPLSEKAIEILRSHMVNKFPEDFIFTLTPPVLRKAWKEYSGHDIVGLYDATRHSFCTQIVEMGINSLQAKDLMRHDKIQSTEKYFHASVTKLRDIVNKRKKVVVPLTRSKLVPERNLSY